MQGDLRCSAPYVLCLMEKCRLPRGLEQRRTRMAFRNWVLAIAARSHCISCCSCNDQIFSSSFESRQPTRELPWCSRENLFCAAKVKNTCLQQNYCLELFFLFSLDSNRHCARARAKPTRVQSFCCLHVSLLSVDP